MFGISAGHWGRVEGRAILNRELVQQVNLGLEVAPGFRAVGGWTLLGSERGGSVFCWSNCGWAVGSGQWAVACWTAGDPGGPAVRFAWPAMLRLRAEGGEMCVKSEWGVTAS